MTDDEKNKQIMHFVDVATIQDVADKEFEKQKEFLHELIPSADIQHVGSTAVPGSITKGDVDIQVRVDKDIFGKTCELLSEHYNPNRKDEIWTDGFASFENYKNPTIPVGVQLTVIDSPYDEFYKMRDLMISDEQLLSKYNAIKRQCEGKTYKEYRKLKRGLFGANGSSPLLEHKLILKKAMPEEANVLADILSSGVRNKVAHGDMVWGSEPYTANELHKRIAKGNTYIARLGGEPIGTLLLIWEDEMTWGEQPPIAAYVHQIVVKEGYHGQNLGAKLLDWANQQAATKGKKLLRIDVPPENRGLRSYYESLGFKWVQDREVHTPHETYVVALYERPVA